MERDDILKKTIDKVNKLVPPTELVLIQLDNVSIHSIFNTNVK